MASLESSFVIVELLIFESILGNETYGPIDISNFVRVENIQKNNEEQMCNMHEAKLRIISYLKFSEISLCSS